MAPVKALTPPRPRISATYEAELKKAPVGLQKEAIKHEWDWHGWGDKMQERTR